MYTMNIGVKLMLCFGAQKQSLAILLIPNATFSYFFVSLNQSDEIGRFIGLWATFQSLWQHLICPNLLLNYVTHAWQIP